MRPSVQVEMHDGVAVITLDTPGEKANILNAAFLGELEKTARELEAGHPTSAVVLSAKSGGFIAGADIHEIEAVTDSVEGAALAREGQRVFGLWSDLPFPVIAALHGHCLGGGTEFALACDFRIAAPDVTIALPEVKLGILPGFGGTQRLPRLISIEKALEMILSGRHVQAEEALQIALVDRLAPPAGLLDEALVLAREAALDARHLLGARRRKQKSLRACLLERNALGRAVLFARARKTALARSSGHYPAPQAIIDVIRRGLSLSMEEGLKLEAEELGRLVATPVCKNLIHVFFLSQRPKKMTAAEGKFQVIERAAVLGAGVMGGGIAQLLADKGIPVLVKDIHQEAVDAGLDHARRIFHRQLVKRGQSELAVAEKMRLLTGTTDYQGFSEADLVLEAVVEKMSVKQEVLREVEPLLKEAAIFATNTSVLSVSELQSVSRRPGNIAGMHFFNPVNRMPLVEVVRGRQTTESTVRTLFETARRLGKTPILVADCPGFLVNRLLGAYLNEACHLVTAGVDWQTLDRQAKAFGLPMGPFRLIDEVGIDIAAEVGKTLGRNFTYLSESPLFGKAIACGLKGKRGNKGFYIYQEGKSSGPNRDIDQLLGLRKVRDATTFDLRKLLLLMVNEAGRCLEEEVVKTPEDVDTGMVFGTGFPPFHGGLCRWADEEGVPGLVEELSELSTSSGRRFEPCGYLRSHEAFYR